MSEVLEYGPITQPRGIVGDKPLSHTREVVFDILETGSDRDGDNIIFCNEGNEKVAIITYKFDNVNGDKICYISFFGTQNGINEGYTKMQILDKPIYNSPMAYKIMTQFIEQYCKPNNITRIYLDMDVGKKDFWKRKMGSHLMQSGIISELYSQSTEVCFVLKT